MITSFRLSRGSTDQSCCQRPFELSQPLVQRHNRHSSIKPPAGTAPSIQPLRRWMHASASKSPSSKKVLIQPFPKSQVTFAATPAKSPFKNFFIGTSLGTALKNVPQSGDSVGPEGPRVRARRSLSYDTDSDPPRTGGGPSP